MEEEDEEEK